MYYNAILPIYRCSLTIIIIPPQKLSLQRYCKYLLKPKGTPKVTFETKVER